jgi:hypothetical protein
MGKDPELLRSVALTMGSRRTHLRSLAAAGVVVVGLVVVAQGWEGWGVRCDNEQLASNLVWIEELATRSSQLDHAQRVAYKSLAAGCEGAPAWVEDDLRREMMSGWPDWVSSGRDRSWVESWRVCNFEDAQSVRDFDPYATGMNRCGFEHLVAITPVEYLDLWEPGFGFGAAGAYLERAGASPALLRRYYRVMLLGIDQWDVFLLVEPDRIVYLPHDGEVVAPEAIQDLDFSSHISIDASAPARQVAWPRNGPRARGFEAVRRNESWVLEQRSPMGLPVRAPVWVTESAPTTERGDELHLEPDGWRWGSGTLQPYVDRDSRAQYPPPIESPEQLVVVLDGELLARQFMPLLAVLWRTLEAGPSTEDSLAVMIAPT